MKLARYRRLRWLLGFVLLLGAVLIWHFWPKPTRIIIYNDLSEPLIGVVLQLGQSTMPLPPLRPEESVELACPVTDSTTVDLFLPDATDPLPVGWLDPAKTAHYVLRITPGPSVLVTATPTASLDSRYYSL
jgi:hypothetical protein